MTDEMFMKRTLALARKGAGRVSPNPLVGAVIAKDGRIIAEGYHRYCGGAHAEIDAIGRATEPVRGATIYVNLEPCCHEGRTPACVATILRHRPARVVVGALDPNPLVSGKGVEILAREGIQVTTGVLEQECIRLNEVFFKWITTGLPFVTLKFAQSLDGRIATASGHSRWISSLASLKFAHRLRAGHDAVLVGRGTLLNDDPELTTRFVKGRSPLRIVADSRLSLPLSARVLQDQDRARTLIVTTNSADREKRDRLLERGIEIIATGDRKTPGVDLHQMLIVLGQRGITSLLVEGGSGLITSFLISRCVDRLVMVQAPKIIGTGINSVGDLGTGSVADAIKIESLRLRRVGGDLIIDGRIGKD